MITLSQIHELRNRTDALRLSLLSVKEDNAFLKDELRNSCERIEELETELERYRANDATITAEVVGLMEELDKELDTCSADTSVDNISINCQHEGQDDVFDNDQRHDSAVTS